MLVAVPGVIGVVAFLCLALMGVLTPFATTSGNGVVFFLDWSDSVMGEATFSSGPLMNSCGFGGGGGGGGGSGLAKAQAPVCLFSHVLHMEHQPTCHVLHFEHSRHFA